MTENESRTTVELVKNQSIGQVLFIVEGDKTEPDLLYRVFCKIYGYELERIEGNPQNPKYRVYGKPKNPDSRVRKDPDSRVIVVNAENSNITSIRQGPGPEGERVNQYLDDLFTLLIEEHKLNIDNAAIYYLFDRDPKSNTDAQFIRNMLARLDNARDSNSWERQGLLLLSYPGIESFTAMNLLDGSLTYCWENGLSICHDLKKALDRDKKEPNQINERTLAHCVEELLAGLEAAGVDTETETLLNSFDRFCDNNLAIFECQEDCYRTQRAYACLSLLCVALLDLGLIRVKTADAAENSS